LFPRLIPCRPARVQKIFARQPFKFFALDGNGKILQGFSPPERVGRGEGKFSKAKR
jgi:hypothetical protein